MIEPVEVHVQGQRIRVRGDAANEPLALDVHVDAECETREVNAIFRAATLGEHRIAGTREFLVGDRIRFETRPTKDLRVFC